MGDIYRTCFISNLPILYDDPVVCFILSDSKYRESYKYGSYCYSYEKEEIIPLIYEIRGVYELNNSIRIEHYDEFLLKFLDANPVIKYRIELLFESVMNNPNDSSGYYIAVAHKDIYDGLMNKFSNDTQKKNKKEFILKRLNYISDIINYRDLNILYICDHVLSSELNCNFSEFLYNLKMNEYLAEKMVNSILFNTIIQDLRIPWSKRYMATGNFNNHTHKVLNNLILNNIKKTGIFKSHLL